MATFALVHGAWCGDWCWERLVGPLRDRGHEVALADLPREDPDAGLDAYADAIAAALDGAEDGVVVGHSLSGLPLPLVPARTPVQRIVYLAAFVPVPGMSMVDQFQATSEPILTFPGGGRETDESGRSYWDPELARQNLFGELNEADAAWAAGRIGPQGQRTQSEPCPEGLPHVDGSYVVCSHDPLLNPPWSRRVARERLGEEAVELEAGHFAMVSHPDALADALDGIVSGPA